MSFSSLSLISLHEKKKNFFHKKKQHENYQKRMDLLGTKDLSSLNYVRSTVPSTHSNQYDFPSEQRRRPKVNLNNFFHNFIFFH